MRALVIDGYNAICKIPGLRKIMDKDLSGARSSITFMAEEYKRTCGGIARTVVVFDGRDEYMGLNGSGRGVQRFSRTGQGDDEIIAVVKKLSLSYDVSVVSDDNYIRNNARAHGAAIIPVSGFTAYLSKKNKKFKPQPYKEKHAGKVSASQARAINEELKKIWKI
jgi:predicted RNA-binding protein with PIN domain